MAINLAEGLTNKVKSNMNSNPNYGYYYPNTTTEPIIDYGSLQSGNDINIRLGNLSHENMELRMRIAELDLQIVKMKKEFDILKPYIEREKQLQEVREFLNDDGSTPPSVI